MMTLFNSYCHYMSSKQSITSCDIANASYSPGITAGALSGCLSGTCTPVFTLFSQRYHHFTFAFSILAQRNGIRRSQHRCWTSKAQRFPGYTQLFGGVGDYSILHDRYHNTVLLQALLMLQYLLSLLAIQTSSTSSVGTPT